MSDSQTKTNIQDSTSEVLDETCTIMLYNDNVHTFEYVIENLIKWCRHTYEQAMQCTWITHCYGKCDIMHGTYAKLKVIADILIDKGLHVEIIY